MPNQSSLLSLTESHKCLSSYPIPLQNKNKTKTNEGILFQEKKNKKNKLSEFGLEYENDYTNIYVWNLSSKLVKTATQKIVE